MGFSVEKKSSSSDRGEAPRGELVCTVPEVTLANPRLKMEARADNVGSLGSCLSSVKLKVLDRKLDIEGRIDEEGNCSGPRIDPRKWISSTPSEIAAPTLGCCIDDFFFK